MTEHNKLDLRLHAWREDIAAAHLRGQVEAAQYVDGTDMQITAPVADLRALPSDEAGLQTQLLYGETFCVYEQKNNWAWGQSGTDNYVGYMRADNLGQTGQAGQTGQTGQKQTPPDHQIATLCSFMYSAPDIKSPPMMALSMGARVKITAQTGRFAQVAKNGGMKGGWMIGAHLRRLNTLTADYVTDYIAAAMQFMDTAYLWGGRSYAGLDCSALIQIALMQAGLACPRDSDMQEAALGQAVWERDSQAGDLQEVDLQAGDLVFWRGHVGILQSPDKLIHANAGHMKTSLEDFATARKRIAETQGDISSIRRLPKPEKN